MLPKSIRIFTLVDFIFLSHRDYNEQYLTPNEEIIYRINPYYLTGGDRVQIQFDGFSHGTFTVCMAYNKHFEQSECQTNSDYQTIVFDVITCEDQNACDTVYLKISVEQSSVKCIGKYYYLLFFHFR